VQVRTKRVGDEAKPKLSRGPQHPCHEDATGHPAVGSTARPTKHMAPLQGHSLQQRHRRTFTGSAADSVVRRARRAGD